MPDRLQEYRAKRDFSHTPEPGPARVRAETGGNRFVIQEHHARRLHYDLRIEHEGVLLSFAIPKGIPPAPKQNHLAVHTEDHPLGYLDFEGEIPAGSYGAGQMNIWDRGTFDLHKFTPSKIVLTLHGRKVEGTWALFQTDGKNWMIHRMEKRPELPTEMPTAVEPMKARRDALPRNDEAWGYEIKWDGVRAIVYVLGENVVVQSRNLRDITAQYPELRELGDALGERATVIDGEIVALDEQGLPSFQRLQGRMNLASPRDVAARAREIPVTFMAFDLLYLDGRNVMSLPYRERRRMLEDLELKGEHVQTPAFHAGEGAEFLQAAATRGLEGIMAKRLDSAYEPGRRSGAWIKLKNVRGQEVVIGGWLPGEGRRGGTIGALLVGYYEDGAFRYAGNVGTGFTDAELDRLQRLLDPLRTEASPFAEGNVDRRAVYVHPALVAEVEFTEWTQAGILRHPSYKGLRDDRDPREVVREPEVERGV